MKPEDFVRRWLTVITWVGSSTCWYAEHYTASVLDENGHEEFRGHERLSEKSAIADAVKWAKEQKMSNLILFHGEYAVCDPMKILVGPKNLKRAANIIWREMEASGGWYQGDMRTITPEGKQRNRNARKISDKWNALFGIKYT